MSFSNDYRAWMNSEKPIAVCTRIYPIVDGVVSYEFSHNKEYKSKLFDFREYTITTGNTVDVVTSVDNRNYLFVESDQQVNIELDGDTLTCYGILSADLYSVSTVSIQNNSGSTAIVKVFVSREDD